MNGSGIQVVSEHELSLSAGKTLSLHADGELNIQAAEAIYFKAGSSSLVLDGETDIRSAKVQLEGTVKKPVFVAELAPVWEPPLMSVKAYTEAQAAKSAANSTAGGSSNSSATSKDGGAVKSVVNTPSSPKASLLDGVLGLAQKVCDVAASIPVLGAIPKAASQKIASIRSEVASSGPSSILKYAVAGLTMIASVPSHGWGVVLGKTAKVAAQTLHAHAEEQRARERHAMMDFLGKVWTRARGYGEVQSISDFINYVKGVNQASVQAYSDVPSDIRERWYQRNVDQQFEKALDAYYNNQDLSTDIVALMEHQRQTDNHFRYSDRALMSSKYRDDMKGYTTEQKKYLIDFLNSIDDYRKEYGPFRESPFMKDLDETERIVFNEIKNSAHESVEAIWERIRNFPNLDIRQMAIDNFEGKKDVADKIVKVITEPDDVYEKTKNSSKQENAHLLVEAAFAFVVGRKGKRHSRDDGASPGGSPHKKEDHSSEGTPKAKTGYTGGRTQKELDDLAGDPSHGGKIRDQGLKEREIGLDLEQQGKLGKIVRDPQGNGGAEFIDTTNNAKWDVKSFVSYPNGHTSPKKGAFTVNNGMKAINKELDKNYNVIVDKRDMIPEHVEQLKEAIEKAGISDRIIWYP
ncbi:hypothetical protein ACWHAM_16475 [Paenibacillus terrae]